MSTHTPSSTSREMTGAEILLECLALEGVDCIFGYPGGVTLPFYDAIRENEVKHVLVRHEQNAVFAASGYARATGRVGVCCATSGPGATNLVTGLVDCMMDSIPVVALTGQVHSSLIGSDAFQEADTFSITRPATKHNYLVQSVEDLPRVIHEAFFIAGSGRPGPVLVDIPKDVFQAKMMFRPLDFIHLPGYQVAGKADPLDVGDAARMIETAAKPLIYAGGGIIASGASEELRELVALTNAPAVCTFMGLGAIPTEHPNFISMPGMHGSYASNMAMTESDLLIALGVRFDDRVTGKLQKFAPNAKVIHVDIDPAELNKNRAADIGIVGDVKQVLAQLNAELKRAGEALPAERDEWLAQVHGWMSEHPFDRAESKDEIRPQHLMREIDRLSGGQAIISTDVGQHQMWAAQLIRFNEPRLWLSSGGLGSMGFGLPSAIGAQMARPEKMVFAICGDGGFQMSIPELSTIAVHQLPLKMIVMNNGCLGMVRQWQTLFYGNRLSEVALDCFPDAQKLASAYGIEGRTIDKPGDLAEALETAARHPGPYLLEVRVSPNENVYPMVPAGAAINEMVLGPEAETVRA